MARNLGGLTQVEYSHAHYLVYRRFGKPKGCEQCGESDPTKRYEWANQTGDYFNTSDYRRMCKPCHQRFDAARRTPRYTSFDGIELLTAKQAARTIGVHLMTVFKLVREGHIAAYRFGRQKEIRVSRVEAERLCAEGLGSRRQRTIRQQFGRPAVEIVRDAVYRDGLTLAEAGRLFDPPIDASTACRWLQKYEREQAATQPEPVAAVG